MWPYDIEVIPIPADEPRNLALSRNFTVVNTFINLNRTMPIVDRNITAADFGLPEDESIFMFDMNFIYGQWCLNE